MKAELNLKKTLLGSLEAELQRALQVHAQSCQAYVLYDLDLGKYTDKVGQLMDRWQRVEKQVDDRFVLFFQTKEDSPQSSTTIIMMRPALCELSYLIAQKFALS